MENMKIYMWKFRDSHTIFALASNLEEAKKAAIENITGNPLKAEVMAAVEGTPSITEGVRSFIFETGPQLIG